MRYPIAIRLGSEMTYCKIVVPDLSGCFTVAACLPSAIIGVKLAIKLWVKIALELGDVIPTPTSLGVVRQNPDFSGWLFDVIDVRSDGELVKH